MDRHIGDHAPAHKGFTDETQDEFSPLNVVQLVRKREIDFTGELRVLARFHSLNVIPELLPVRKEWGGTLRPQHLRMNYATPAAEIANPSVPDVMKPLTRPVRRHRDRRAPLASSDNLDREVIGGHT
jgi:hypothetical protein